MTIMIQFLNKEDIDHMLNEKDEEVWCYWAIKNGNWL